MTVSSLTRDQTLWLVTTHPDTWKLDDAPAWLVAECIDSGFVVPTNEPGVWKKTALAHELLQKKLRP